jgi:hypothetical protein
MKHSTFPREELKSAAVSAPHALLVTMTRPFFAFALAGSLAALGCNAGGGDSTFWDPQASTDGNGGFGAGTVTQATTSTSVTSATTTTSTGFGGSAVTSSSVGPSTSAVTTATTGPATVTSTTVASSTIASSSTGGTTATWTEVYDQLFGPNGTGHCSTGGGCHQSRKSGFACGSSSSSCYSGFVSAGWIDPGANASSSPIVDPSQSPLCGSLGGNMPPHSSCYASSEIQLLQQWLDSGAPEN